MTTLDTLISRVLFVTPQVTADPATPETDDTDNPEGQKAENVMGLSLVFSGIRCTLQYAILPFVLPLIGVASAWAVGLTLVVNVVAIVALVGSVRHMWRINYRHKWRYFAIAVPAFVVLVAFFVLDVIALV